MSDMFATIAERDEYFDTLVNNERILFERKMDELRRAYAENIRELEDRRKWAVIGNPAPDDIEDTEDVEGDEMQDDEQAGVL
jgi:hypothetical protein